jgi:hypothetical protein
VVAEEMYVSGGNDDDERKITSVGKYSVASDSWSDAVPLPEARSSHATVAMGSNMYVLSGSVGEDEDDVLTLSVIKFDSVQGIWSDVAPMPNGRRVATACAIGNDIFVFGGEDNEIDRQDSVFKCDTGADEWSTLAPMPHASCKHSISVLGGLVYVVGIMSITNEFFSFDPESGVWSTLAPTLHNHFCVVTFVQAGCLYAAGGIFPASSHFGVECYDVASDTWTAVTEFSEERRTFCAITIESSGPAEEQDLFDSLITKASSMCRP